MDLKEGFREWKKHREKQDAKMVPCYWCDMTGIYKTKVFPGRECIRCGRRTDKNGKPIRENDDG